MPKPTYRRCRHCKRNREDAGVLSHTRLCADCSRHLLHENIDGLHTMSGGPLDRWRRGMAASVGAVLVDDVKDSA